MTYTLFHRKRHSWRRYDIAASALLSGSLPNWWDTSDVFFTMYEEAGNTHRDFAVPMSSFARGKRTDALGGGYQRLQDFVSDSFACWILSQGRDSNGDGVAGLTHFRRGTDRRADAWTLNYISAMPRMTDEAAFDPVHTAAELTDPSGRVRFTMGYGHGAVALSGDRFGVTSDFDRATGGVNPILGFASGEFCALAGMKLGADTGLSIGFSENRLDADEEVGLNPLQRRLLADVDGHQAHAFTATLEHRVSPALSLGLQYTDLAADDALLGAQSSIAGLLDEGSRTRAVSLSATVAVDGRTRFDLSATANETTLEAGQFLSSRGGAVGTAAQFAVTRQGLVTGRDTLRLAVGQSLTIERGGLEFNSLQVIDRATGERGVVSQTIGIETKRQMMGDTQRALEIAREVQDAASADTPDANHTRLTAR